MIIVERISRNTRKQRHLYNLDAYFKFPIGL